MRCLSQIFMPEAEIKQTLQTPPTLPVTGPHLPPIPRSGNSGLPTLALGTAPKYNIIAGR